MLDVFIDALIDSLKILPFLFLSYLLIEYIEHKSSEKLEKALSTSGKYSKVVSCNYYGNSSCSIPCNK